MTKAQRLAALQEAATDLYAAGSDDNIEVDDLTRKDISEGCDGIWVRAWVHVPNEELRKRGISNPHAD